MPAASALHACLAFLLAFGLAPAAAAAPAAPREVAVTYPSQDVSLAALLLLPRGSRPGPAIVVAQGSGESDRSNIWARSVADVFVEAGFVVLLTDKRGSGASGGDWRTAGFDALAADALAGVRYLMTHREVDPRKIGLVGLSQGGRVVPLAAAQSADVAFVINLVGDTLSFAEQSMHEMSNVARQVGLSDEQRRQVLELNSAIGRGLLTGDMSEYRRLREAALKSPWARVAQGFPAADDPVLSFYGKAVTFNPMPYWLLVRQPVLVLYGEEDEQDNVAVAESTRRLRFGFEQVGKTNYQIVIIPGVGHDLGWRPGEGLGAAATEAIKAWLAANVNSRGRSSGG